MRKVCPVCLALISVAGHQVKNKVFNKQVKEPSNTPGKERLLCACSRFYSKSSSGCFDNNKEATLEVFKW